MIKIEKWTKDVAVQESLLARAPLVQNPVLVERVSAILQEVRLRGDSAVREMTARFDGVQIEDCAVSEKEMTEALGGIGPEMRRAFDLARENIAAFHNAQRPLPISVETMPGVRCELQWRALDSVGLYVPGGTAPLFSTVFMLAIPAALAGCREIALCAPPQKDGKINRETLAAAKLCGVTSVFAVGGAQAIGAMAYGTAKVPKVGKILGPGNAYVTMAKQLVSQESGGCAVDMPAGPSEVMVMAEAGSRAQWVAADLLAQAEHDAVSQAVLVTCSENFAREVQQEVMRQLQGLSRKAIVQESLKISRIIIATDQVEAIEIANRYAPEHLIIYGENATAQVSKIRTASAIFVGDYTPETAGDYASGGNHVLPTYGAARAYSGLSLYSFMKSVSVQQITPLGLKSLAPSLIAMAKAEGLDAHAAAVQVRMGARGESR